MPGELEAPTAARGACACQTVTRKRMCEQRGVGPARAQGAGRNSAAARNRKASLLPRSSGTCSSEAITLETRVCLHYKVSSERTWISDCLLIHPKSPKQCKVLNKQLLEEAH